MIRKAAALRQCPALNGKWQDEDPIIPMAQGLRFCERVRDCCLIYTKTREMIDKFSVIPYSYFIAFASEKGHVFGGKELFRNNFPYSWSFSPPAPLDNQLHSPLWA